jgi:hypothetical protein
VGRNAGWTASKVAKLLMIIQCNAHAIRTDAGEVVGLG